VSKSVVYLADVRAHRQGWSKHELEHLHRAVNLLSEAGLTVETDSGVTDEGDPWLVFCDTVSGDVLAHFARLSAEYVVCSPLLDGALTGRDFPDLVERFLAHRPHRRRASVGSKSTPAA